MTIIGDFLNEGEFRFALKLQELTSGAGSGKKNREGAYLKAARIQAWGEEIPCKAPDAGAGPGLLAGLIRLRRKLA